MSQSNYGGGGWPASGQDSPHGDVSAIDGKLTVEDIKQILDIVAGLRRTGIRGDPGATGWVSTSGGGLLAEEVTIMLKAVLASRAPAYLQAQIERSLMTDSAETSDTGGPPVVVPNALLDANSLFERFIEAGPTQDACFTDATADQSSLLAKIGLPTGMTSFENQQAHDVPSHYGVDTAVAHQGKTLC